MGLGVSSICSVEVITCEIQMITQSTVDYCLELDNQAFFSV